MNHMNQPISSCRTYYEEVLQINEALFQVTNNDLSHPTPHSTPGAAPRDSFDAHDMDYTLPMEVDSEALDAQRNNDSLLQPSATPYPFFKETHPTASNIYGIGHTFMDVFEKDQYAQRRVEQLYYPFASKDEWELASFLLRSNLSMASIDKFLKLNLVGASPVSFYFSLCSSLGDVL